MMNILKMKQQTKLQNWKEKPLEEVLDYEQPVNYILNTKIKSEGKTPVLTPGKSFIKGYTDETEGICDKLPIILFDDFTTSSKFVNFPFKVKSSALKILRPKNDSVDLNFVYYQMQTKNINFTTHKRYYISRYAKLPFIFPVKENGSLDSETQSQIVSAIESNFSKIDNAIKNLKSAKNKIGLYRKAVLKKAFEKGEDWEEKTLNEVCEKINQIIPQKENFNEFYYLDIASINNQKQKIESPKLINSKDAPSRARQETISGDILYSTVRTYLRNIAVVPELDEKIISSTGFVILRPKKQINSKWIFYLLNTEKLNNDISRKQVGTSYPAIRKSDLLNYKIAFPPSLPSQQKIVSSIESKFSVIDKVEEAVNNSLAKAEKLKKSILKSAFEGRLVGG